MIQPISKLPKEKVEGDWRDSDRGCSSLLSPMAPAPTPYPHDSQRTIRSLPSPTRAHMSEQDDRARSHVRCETASASICASKGASTRTLPWRSYFYLRAGDKHAVPPLAPKASGRDTKRPAQSKSLFERVCNGGSSIMELVLTNQFG
jgi:hypothetical protein